VNHSPDERSEIPGRIMELIFRERRCECRAIVCGARVVATAPEISD